MTEDGDKHNLHETKNFLERVGRGSASSFSNDFNFILYFHFPVNEEFVVVNERASILDIVFL